MIYTEVIYEAAKKENLLPTEEEVNKSIEEFNTSIKDNDAYKKQLKELGIDDNFLKYQFERNLASDNYKEKFNKDSNYYFVILFYF